MKSFCKKLVSTALAGAMLVGLIPTSALAVHTDEGSIAQSNPLADSAKIFLNSTGDNDTLLPSAYDDSRYNLPNRGLVGENQYINIIPITPEQVENGTTIDLYAQAEVTMSEFVAGVLCEESTPLDISKTKFMVFMAVSDSMTVDTDTDFLFNSTFLMPDEEAMGDGITVTRDTDYHSEYNSETAIDMRWKISGALENLRIENQTDTSSLATTEGTFSFEAFLNDPDSYLVDTGIREGAGSVTYLHDQFLNAWNSLYSEGGKQNYNVNIYAIPVKMNWSALVEAAQAGEYEFQDLDPDIVDKAFVESVNGDKIYDRFEPEDFMCPMYLTANSGASDYEGIKFSVNLGNVQQGYLGKQGFVSWMTEGKIDNFIPTSSDIEPTTNTVSWYEYVDAMPVGGTIIGNIYQYNSTTATESTIHPYNNQIIDAGIILNQFAYATPGAITVTKTIEGLPGDVEMPDSLAITITDQNGNPARDLSGNVVTASIGKADWTYDAATGNWTATKTIEGLRPSDDTYGWDYQYNVAVEEETGFEGYEVDSAVKITGGENIELDNGYYDLTREDNGDVTYEPRDDAAVPPVVVHSSYKQGTTPPEKVTLTYDPNGGDGPNKTETKELVDEKAEFTVIENPFTRDEADGVTYTFDGWNTQANGGGTDYAPRDQITLTEDETLYAQWKAEGEEPVEPPATTISKTLSGNLDKDNQTDVTLSIPSKGSEQTVDVVLAMDCTSLLAEHGADVIQNIGTLGDELLEKNINLSVGVVGFGRESRVVHELTALNKGNSDSWAADIAADIWENQAWFLNNVGTNIQGGIRMAQEVLDRSTTGADENHKYIVLITDGGAYWYCDDQDIDGDGNTSEAVNKFFYNGETFWGALGNMDGNGDVGDKDRTTHLSQSKDFADFMNTFGGAVENSIAPSYTYEQLANPTEGMVALTAGEVQSDDFILNIERGTYLAARELEKALDNGYQLITIGYPYENAENAPALRTVSDSFLAWTGTIGDYYDGDKLDSAFSDLADQIAYFVDAGSYVIDETATGYSTSPTPCSSTWSPTAAPWCGTLWATVWAPSSTRPPRCPTSAPPATAPGSSRA